MHVDALRTIKMEPECVEKEIRLVEARLLPDLMVYYEYRPKGIEFDTHLSVSYRLEAITPEKWALGTEEIRHLIRNRFPCGEVVPVVEDNAHNHQGLGGEIMTPIRCAVLCL